MTQDAERNPFLDTSIARPFLLDPQQYRDYLRRQFGDQRLYVSPYIRMEFHRNFLCNVIHFYFTLNLPTINTIGEAISFWSHRFKGSELKAVLGFVAQVFDARDLGVARPQDKARALQSLGLQIKRLYLKFRLQFTDIGQDATRCERARVPLKAEVDDLSGGFKRFLDVFEDLDGCRRKCRIDQFILTRFRSEVEDYITRARGLSTNAETKGFKSIVQNLEDILEKGASACSCKRCERIGDAVIALSAPRDMRLDHTDRSFDYLCPPLNQPHRRHPSVTSVLLASQTR